MINEESMKHWADEFNEIAEAKDQHIADLERQLAARIQESNEWEALARDRQEEIEAMRPMIEACEYRYKTHKYYSPPEDVTCTCLTCQWYRDYEARKPK